MRRRVVGIIGALLLAGLGTAALVAYVDGAESRALEGETLTSVLVVQEPVPAGTPVESLSTMVAAEEIPVKVRATDAVSDLEGAAGLVTAVDLVAGEQLVASRLVDPTGVRARAEGVQVPAGLVEVTVDLSPTRSVGGLIGPGDTVAVLASFDVGAGGEGAESAESAAAGNTTHLIVHKVLVTGVQTVEAATAEADETPTSNLLVTLAVSPADAERIVFTAEFGRIWLAAEGSEVDESGTRVQSGATVYAETEVATQ